MPKGIVLNTLETLIEALKGTQYPTIIFLAEGNALTIQEIINAIKGENLENLPKQVAISSKQLEVAVQDKDNVLPVSDFSSLPELQDLVSQLGLDAIAFLPITRENDMYGLVLVGSTPEQQLSNFALQPYKNIVQLASKAIHMSYLLGNRSALLVGIKTL